MNRIISSVMGTFIAAVVGFGSAPTAQAVVYITGSVSGSNSYVPLQTYKSTSASGSVAVDLGSYMRIGLTHKQESQVSEGYKDVSETTGVANTYVETRSKAHIISNSVDLTLILYEGSVFLPYLNIGVIVKKYRFDTEEAGQTAAPMEGTSGPAPNLGMGLGIRLNREFSLKLSYLVSPGETYNPGDEKSRMILDRSTSIGLTYQF